LQQKTFESLPENGSRAWLQERCLVYFCFGGNTLFVVWTVSVNPKLQLNRGVKPKNHCLDIKAEEFLKNPQVIVDDFKEQREKCDAANTGCQRFGNSITAANHYQKHLNFPKNDQKVKVSKPPLLKWLSKFAKVQLTIRNGLKTESL
jgi:hypothetical protein